MRICDRWDMNIKKELEIIDKKIMKLLVKEICKNLSENTVRDDMPQTKSMGDREELVKKLKSMLAMIDFYKNRPPEEILADFILEDRKRIVEPLYIWKQAELKVGRKKIWDKGYLQKDIDIVLKKAGVE